MPAPRALVPDLITAVREITDRFVMSPDGTPVHIAKSKLEKKHDLLEAAVHGGYLQHIGQKYFPKFRALELADNDTRASVERCTSLVLEALEAIYQRNGDQMSSQEEILEAGKAIDPSASPECIVVGMLFAIDFQTTCVQTWSASHRTIM